MTDVAAAREIDYSPLLITPSAADVAAYRESTQHLTSMVDGAATVIRLLRCAFWGGVALVALLFVISMVSFIRGLLTGSSIDVTSQQYAVGITVVLVVGVLFFRRFPIGSIWPALLKLDSFARSNDMDFWIESELPDFPASAFIGASAGSSTYMRLRSRGAATVELSNYLKKGISPSEGTEEGTAAGGYLAIELNRQLPNMLLKSRTLQTFSGVPRDYDDKQTLSLEGDFDRYFALYCPTGYERDALYIFTPDLMALLIDHAAGFDVEIVDNWLFVYSNLPIVRPDIVAMSRSFRIIALIGAKALRASNNYRDARAVGLPPGSVAWGRRLARRQPRQ
jgi:hypothetical protein